MGSSSARRRLVHVFLAALLLLAADPPQRPFAFATTTQYVDTEGSRAEQQQQQQQSNRNEAREEEEKSRRGPPVAYSRRQRHPLADLIAHRLDNSWLTHLSPETPSNRLRSHGVAAGRDHNSRNNNGDEGTSNNDDASNDGNNVQRPVYNGHYVAPVRPSPLTNPRLVIHAPDVAASLGLTESDVATAEFVKFVSGDVESAIVGLGLDDFDDDDDDDASGSHPKKKNVTTWATPYALSIMGERYTSNCPFGTGVGYGDGRALSIGEFLLVDDADVDGDDGGANRTGSATSGGSGPSRYELQLKGAGPTPFCRGADGRAVLRSSVREFLASEAMHHLGVPTTRALSLVVSDGGPTGGGCTVRRPWYSDSNRRDEGVPTLDDPRLARYPPEQRRTIIADINARRKSDPDVMITEPCAITCRASPSYVRVGHLDLFARRVVEQRRRSREDDGSSSGEEPPPYDTATLEWSELTQMVWHAAYRDFAAPCHDPYRPADDIAGAARCLVRRSMAALSTTVSHWIRVGFAQGNFNADNCLVSGRTVDYGPFGFVDEYHPHFAKWTGSGTHFGFMKQPDAGLANFMILAESVMPILEANLGRDEADRFLGDVKVEARDEFRRTVREAFRVKLGFRHDDGAGDDVWAGLEPLLRAARVDWTVFWRQLTVVAREFPVVVGEGGGGASPPPSEAYSDMLDVLCADEGAKPGSSPFYVDLDDEYCAKFTGWIQQWRTALSESYRTVDGPSALERLSLQSSDAEACISPEQRMRMANPKYTLREWMLVEAYTKASAASYRPSSTFPLGTGGAAAPGREVQNDESVIHELYALLQDPYGEGTDEQDRKYYRRAPDEALRAGGTAFMS